MTKLEKAYFDTFTLPRLKSFYKAVAKEANCSTDWNYSDHIVYHGWSYVTRTWMRPGGIAIEIRINKRKIREAIREREEQLGKQADRSKRIPTKKPVLRKTRRR